MIRRWDEESSVRPPYSNALTALEIAIATLYVDFVASEIAATGANAISRQLRHALERTMLELPRGCWRKRNTHMLDGQTSPVILDKATLPQHHGTRKPKHTQGPSRRGSLPIGLVEEFYQCNRSPKPHN